MPTGPTEGAKANTQHTSAKGSHQDRQIFVSAKHSPNYTGHVKRDTLGCLESWSEELLSRAERVRRLIGNAHWLSDGHHKEELVRQFLSRHLPPSLRISRGFICPPENDLRVSSEIDVLITDTWTEMPWFTEGNLIIAPPSCVLGQLHVKTEFDVDGLTDVLSSGARNQKIVTDSVSRQIPWFGAIFFTHSKPKKPKRLKEVFRKAILKASNGGSDVPTRERFPDCVAVVGGPVFLADKRTTEGAPRDQIRIRVFDGANLSPAVMLVHLFDSIQLPGRDLARRGEWVQLLASAEIPSLFSEPFDLTLGTK